MGKYVGGDENHDPLDGEATPRENVGDEPPVAGGLPRLMARIGRLVEQHGADGVVVVSGEEHERVKLAAYAAGWQDAAEEYRPRITAARWEGWLGRWRPLRPMEGDGEVIAFPAGGRPAAGADPADGRTQEPGEPGEPAADGAAPRAGARRGTPVRRPYLSPKNRRSKSPTIPRLAPPDRRRPRTAGDGPDDAAD